MTSKDLFLSAAKNSDVLEVLQSIEDKILERGLLVSLTGDSESEITIKYEWIAEPGSDDDEEEAGWLVVRVNANVKDDPDEDDLEGFRDYISEKLSDEISSLEEEVQEKLADYVGEMIFINGEKVY